MIFLVLLWSVIMIFLLPFFYLKSEWSPLLKEVLGLSLMSEKNLLVMLVVVVSSILVYTYFYMENPPLYFLSLLMLFVFSMVILLAAKSYFVLFIGWDGLGVTSFLLVMFYMNYKSNNNSMLTFLSNRVGDMFFLLMLSSLLFTPLLILPLMLLALTSMTKSAQFPFSAWLPAAMAAPTPISALVHSSTLVTAGLILLEKLKASESKALLVVGVVTMMMASLSGLKEKDFKKLVALSTLSQLGFMFIMVSIGLSYLMLLHLMMHAFFKSLLFMSVGSILHSEKSTQDSTLFSLSFKSEKSSVTTITVCLISLSGLLFLSGFLSKDLFLEMVPKTSKSLVFLFLGVVSLTLFYSAKMLSMVWQINPQSNTEKSESLLFFNSSTVLFLLSVSGGGVLLKNSFNYPDFFKEKFAPFLILSLLLFFLLPSSSYMELLTNSSSSKEGTLFPLFYQSEILFLEKSNLSMSKVLFSFYWASFYSTFLFLLVVVFWFIL